MAKFFAIEGLSASGKSTVFDLLKGGPEFVGLASIPYEFEPTRHLFKDERHADARFLYFAAALSFTATDISRYLADGTNVIVESFIHRTISFHRGFGATADVRWPQTMPMPDAVFFLQCDEAVRQCRIRNRMRPPNVWDALAEKNRSKILSEYERCESTVIDTTATPPEAVAAQIVGRL